MTIDIQEYRRFIASRATTTIASGFTPNPINDRAKVHQVNALEYALNKGKSAMFLDTGLGKSFIELEFARQCAEETGKPSLILTPLAVAGQMVREGNKFGIDARQIKEPEEVGDGVMVMNYDRVGKLDPYKFGAVILDESSILKSFGGKTSTALMDMFANTPYKMAATATPAPNDHMELGQHCQFLGVMNSNEMLARWFIADQDKMGKYRLKGHAAEPFWRWVADWSRCATLPSDLGGDDTGYDLAPILRNLHTVRSDLQLNKGDTLFRMPEMSATSFHAEKRLTLIDRCNKAAELANHGEPVTVWCETNEESALLAKLIPDSREVVGSMTPDQKEDLLLGFVDGKYRALVTKRKIAGLGMNFQHCARAVSASISFSYEGFYQGERRSHRFGQTKQVTHDVVISDTENSVWQTILRKMKEHEVMKKEMSKAMKQSQNYAGLRIAYGDRIELKMPEWLKGVSA
jgi:superfamily II DNA or RNA helicase